MHILRTRLLLTALVCLGLSVFPQQVFAQPAQWIDLAFGQNVAGTISTPTSVKYYRITAQAQDTIVAIFASTSPELGDFNPLVELSDSSGVQIAASASGKLTAQVTVSGNYYVGVMDDDFYSEGNFALTVQRSNNPGNSTLINFGDTVTAGTTVNAEVKFYTISAQAQDTIVAAFATEVPENGNFTPWLELYDNNGVQLASSVSGRLTSTVNTTGNYYIWIRDDDLYSPGSFSLIVQRTKNPGNSVPINFGETVTGTIAFNADMHFYRINAQAQDTIDVVFATQTPAGGYFDQLVELYDSNGTQIMSSTSGALMTRVPTEGTYYLWVSDADRDGTGTYELTVLENLINSVTASPLVFDPTRGENTSFEFTLDRDCQVTIRIYKAFLDANDVYQRQYIHTIATAVPMSAGVNTFAWDGKDSAGNIMPPSAYVFTIEAVNGTRSVLYDPVYVPGMVEIQNGFLSPADFDPYQGEVVSINYDLLVPAWVKMKVGIILEQVERRTLFINEPRGLHNVDYWDGRDDNGNIVSYWGYEPFVWTTMLPNNAVIIKKPLSIDLVRAQPYAFFPMYQQWTEISYAVSADARVNMVINTPDGSALVRTLVNNELKTAGTYAILWDGKDDFGNVVVTPGHYRIDMSAETPSGANSVTHRGNITVLEVK